MKIIELLSESELNEYRSSYSNGQINLKKFKPGARVSHPLLGSSLGTIVDAITIPIEDRRNTGVPVKPDNTNKIYWMNPGSLEILPENTQSKYNKQGVAEGKIKLYTDPDYYGAEVDDEGFDSLPIVNIPINRLLGFEPDSKMQQPDARKNVRKILAGLEAGDSIPPILVRKYKNGYQVLDGHHRFYAYKIAQKNTVPARVVDPRDIEEIDKQSVAEGVCSKCGGPSFSDLILAEKQDACYHKVRSRYKVWPSAYASGALVQCRKKGAANWGTGGKKKK
jgi:hypothetical protein